MHERNCCAQCLQRHVQLDWSWECSINCGRINHVLFIFTYLHALIKQLETALNYFCIQYQFILLHYTACTVHTYCSTMFILLHTAWLKFLLFTRTYYLYSMCLHGHAIRYRQLSHGAPYCKSILPMTFYNCRANQYLRFVASQYQRWLLIVDAIVIITDGIAMSLMIHPNLADL